MAAWRPYLFLNHVNLLWKTYLEGVLSTDILLFSRRKLPLSKLYPPVKFKENPSSRSPVIACKPIVDVVAMATIRVNRLAIFFCWAPSSDYEMLTYQVSSNSVK